VHQAARLSMIEWSTLVPPSPSQAQRVSSTAFQNRAQVSDDLAGREEAERRGQPVHWTAHSLRCHAHRQGDGHGVLGQFEEPLMVSGEDPCSPACPFVEKKMRALWLYQLTEAVMALEAEDANFFHCLPAHRAEEVVDAVIDGPRFAVWDEAENRLHAQKSMLLWALRKLWMGRRPSRKGPRPNNAQFSRTNKCLNDIR
jgi:hypothetical protein